MDCESRTESLSEEECLHLLGTVPVGRVVYTAHALPAVLPVAFEVAADGRLVLAMRRGADVSRALDDTVAAFQADHLDEATRTGWSVMVHGRAQVVTDPALHERLRRTGPRPWVREAEPMFVTICPELVSGRRLLPSGRAVQNT
ncbi:pyridoxamine 5'-phosphate oxidase family protein [Kitasatospora sp. NPDC057015]|uniref:pyridoxamine 5'-phosphate oxidase family protein n=1 Tax=Kitasatospora sp. NPDC057015 TaxID=3346001 RepID=UPI0036338EC3